LPAGARQLPRHKPRRVGDNRIDGMDPRWRGHASLAKPTQQPFHAAEDARPDHCLSQEDYRQAGMLNQQQAKRPTPVNQDAFNIAGHRLG
jgi:hypothetical protein